MKLLDDKENLVCMTAFMSLDLGGHGGLNWVIGDIFLAHFYVEYDMQNSRVGFANKKPLADE